MRILMILIALSLASQASAGVVVDSVWREVSYYGGLEQPNLMGDSVTSIAMGSFDESFSDFVTSPGVAESGADIAQDSTIDLAYGALVIHVTGDAGTYATSLVGGGIADSVTWNELEVIFTADENVLFSADLFVSSGLGVFYDGPGEGVVESSHVGSILICFVGDGCISDVLVDDVTDNGMAVTDGVLDSALLPPGQYAIELLAVSQSLTPDIGSTQGSAGFSGEIRVEPAPEPGVMPAFAAGLMGLFGLARSRSRRGS